MSVYPSINNRRAEKVLSASGLLRRLKRRISILLRKSGSDVGGCWVRHVWHPARNRALKAAWRLGADTVGGRPWAWVVPAPAAASGAANRGGLGCGGNTSVGALMLIGLSATCSANCGLAKPIPADPEIGRLLPALTARELVAARPARGSGVICLSAFAEPTVSPANVSRACVSSATCACIKGPTVTLPEPSGRTPGRWLLYSGTAFPALQRPYPPRPAPTVSLPAINSSICPLLPAMTCPMARKDWEMSRLGE